MSYRAFLIRNYTMPSKTPKRNGGNTGNLKAPWKPGESGNPNGRPKKHREVAAKAEENAVLAVETLVKLMKSGDERVALAAAQDILDRAVGKPKQVTTNVNVNKEADPTESVSDTAAFLDEVLGAAADREDKESVH